MYEVKILKELPVFFLYPSSKVNFIPTAIILLQRFIHVCGSWVSFSDVLLSLYSKWFSVWYLMVPIILLIANAIWTQMYVQIT